MMKVQLPLKPMIGIMLKVMLTITVSVWFSLPVFAESKPITQRQINEVGASLEEATRTVIDNTGIRFPKENLPDYLKRLMAVLPNEPLPLRSKRVDRYISVLTAAAKRLSPLINQPKLVDVSSDNLNDWSRISRVAKYLPGRVTKLKSAWKAEQKHSSATLATLQKEMLDTMQHVIAALTAIRNCKP